MIHVRLCSAGVIVLLAMVIGAAATGTGHAATVCNIVADVETGAVLHERGRCDERVTPASTFKIPIALMGFDAGILHGEKDPAWPFRKGYPDWGSGWKETTGPAGWMEKSVLWYSHGITRALGEARFARYADAFDYGNRNVRGDDGKANGLTRSWIGSSLRISPREQVAFLRNLLARKLPVKDDARTNTISIMPVFNAGQWIVRGKTGSGPAGKHAVGWFVGWATDGKRTIVFAHRTERPRKDLMRAGRDTRDELLAELPGILRATEP